MSEWDHTSIAIEQEGFVKTGGEYESWYRVWGKGPIKALFVHGGPGNCVAAYEDVNFKILDPSKFTVLEVDQIGTGKSKPSVEETLDNAKFYATTTCHDLAAHLLAVVDELKWDKVYLHGGSWGSTLALLFAQLYPERVTGMVIRGIFTATPSELEVTFCRRGSVATENLRNSFQGFFEFARETGFTGSDEDNQGIVTHYRNVIAAGGERGDKAAWNWWAHELHAMDELEHEFNVLTPKMLPEARAVGFWESHLFSDMAWGANAVDLLKDVPKLPKVPIEIVQGKGDFVCPERYAQALENELLTHGYDVKATYVDGGHKVHGDTVFAAVCAAVRRFAARIPQ